MNPIEKCEQLIDRAWTLMKECSVGREYLEELSALKVKLHQPCELAIAGKVKAGKSSFLNALIGEDLAKVGDLETTATINRFIYGRPDNPDRPIRVVWDDGHETFETVEFMNEMQGHEEKNLSISSKIDFLEYKVENPLLTDLILVDTPGTGAVVDEHQSSAEKYFTLREKHRLQTHKCTAQADAVIYLMGAVANIRDRTFLEDFRENAADGMPLNAIGVLSKVDIDMKLLENREDQAKYLAESLDQQLHTVIPVSSAIHRALDDLKFKLSEWYELVHTIDNEVFSRMIKSPKLFELPSYSSIPVETRKKMKGDLSWSVFRTIISTLHKSSSAENAVKELENIANIKALRQLIDDYFFARSRTIRCTQVLNRLYKICMLVCTLGLMKLKDEISRMSRWEIFLSSFSTVTEAKELSDFVKSNLLVELD